MSPHTSPPPPIAPLIVTATGVAKPFGATASGSSPAGGLAEAGAFAEKAVEAGSGERIPRVGAGGEGTVGEVDPEDEFANLSVSFGSLGGGSTQAAAAKRAGADEEAMDLDDKPSGGQQATSGAGLKGKGGSGTKVDDLQHTHRKLLGEKDDQIAAANAEAKAATQALEKLASDVFKLAVEGGKAAHAKGMKAVELWTGVQLTEVQQEGWRASVNKGIDVLREIRSRAKEAMPQQASTGAAGGVSTSTK
ncbi:hypothetical protein JCM10213v2_007771 [Rhodosporidiobolus nylandii]